MALIIIIIFVESVSILGFPGGSVIKNPLANAPDVGSIPGSGRSPEKEMAAHASILAWRIHWAEEPGGLQFMGLQNSQTKAEQLNDNHK